MSFGVRLLCIKLNITKLRNSFHGTFPLLLGQYGTFLCAAALSPPAYSPFIIHTWSLTLLKRPRAHSTLASSYGNSRGGISDLRCRNENLSISLCLSVCLSVFSEVWESDMQLFAVYYFLLKIGEIDDIISLCVIKSAVPEAVRIILGANFHAPFQQGEHLHS